MARIIIYSIILLSFISTAVLSDEWDDLYKKTTLSPLDLIKNLFKKEEKPSSPYKIYKGAKKIKLSKPIIRKDKGLTIEEAIAQRRTHRNYTDEPVSLEELSYLLYAGCGITDKDKNISFRAAPSGGALYPIELYPVVHNVKGIPCGLYHYSVQDHALELIKEGDFRTEIQDAALGQEPAGNAAVVLIFTAIPTRTTWKYQSRGWRYIYIEVGHISENIYLEATSLGLGVCAVGAFFDDKVNQLIGVDGKKEMAVYLNTVGKIK